MRTSRVGPEEEGWFLLHLGRLPNGTLHQRRLDPGPDRPIHHPLSRRVHPSSTRSPGRGGDLDGIGTKLRLVGHETPGTFSRTEVPGGLVGSDRVGRDTRVLDRCPPEDLCIMYLSTSLYFLISHPLNPSLLILVFFTFSGPTLPPTTIPVQIPSEFTVRLSPTNSPRGCGSKTGPGPC